MYSKVKILNHAVHPMLVGFPITFYFVTFAAYVAYSSTADVFWFRVAHYGNIAGVVAALIAAVPGLIDWGFGIPTLTQAKARGILHASLNTVALVLFVWNLVHMREANRDFFPPIEVTFSIAVTALGLIATAFAGYQGFSLMSVNKVGIDLSPEQESIEPDYPVPMRTKKAERNAPRKII